MSVIHQWREPLALSQRPIPLTGFRIVDEIIARRGFLAESDARAWLRPNITEQTAAADLRFLEPLLRRVEQAIDRGETIHIFGDYDCDGVTSTAIIWQSLTVARGNCAGITWELPARDQGYGLRSDVIRRAVANGVQLLIAIDCGSNDIDLIREAHGLGLDVVVIDHHQISVAIPDDVVVVNPQRGDDPDLQRLTAAGLAYLTVHCLNRDGYRVVDNGANANTYLELAAIGTVADVGVLTGLNRAIVHAGVQALRKTRRWGLKALARSLKVDLANATSEVISFKLAPKLNAPGRVGSPDSALQMLIATDWDTAGELAQAVIEADVNRKVQTEYVMSEVEAVLAQMEQVPPVVVLADAMWSTGVLGPVAAKVSEKHLRPAVILAGADGSLSGSGRSIGNWDLASALQELDHLLLRHGGHAMAAGLILAPDRLPEFRDALSDLYLRSAAGIDLVPTFAVDADLDDDEITLGLVEQIEALGPFGVGNERPILRWRGARLYEWKPVGKDRTHAQVTLNGRSGPLRTVMFGGAARISDLPLGQPMDALVQLSVDVWNGTRRVNAQLIDFQLVR